MQTYNFFLLKDEKGQMAIKKTGWELNSFFFLIFE